MEKQNDNICTERQNDDYDKVIRKLIEKETDIVDTKIRWSFLMHSVLFTAYWEVTKSINEDKAWYIWGLIFIGIAFLYPLFILCGQAKEQSLLSYQNGINTFWIEAFHMMIFLQFGQAVPKQLTIILA